MKMIGQIKLDAIANECLDALNSHIDEKLAIENILEVLKGKEDKVKIVRKRYHKSYIVRV